MSQVEINGAIAQSKIGKAAGKDSNKSEMLRSEMLRVITFTKIWQTEIIPTNWKLKLSCQYLKITKNARTIEDKEKVHESLR